MRSHYPQDGGDDRRSQSPTAADDDLVERIEALGAEARALELLEQLPPDQADAVRARILEQRSYKDIAASVRGSEAVVRKRVSRGLQALRGLAKGRS